MKYLATNPDLEPDAVVGQLADAVEHELHDLLADGVVAAGVVVGGVLLAGHQLLRVEELPVHSGPHLVDDGGLQVHEDRPGHVLAAARLREECVVGVVAAAPGILTTGILDWLNTKIQRKTLICHIIIRKPKKFLFH